MFKRILLSAAVTAMLQSAAFALPYTATWSGRELKLETARISSVPFCRVWPGHQRELSQTEIAYFVRFDLTRPSSLVIRGERVGAALRRTLPLSEQVSEVVGDDELRLEINRSGAYVLEFDGLPTLHVFADPPLASPPVPAPGGRLIHFAAGEHHPGVVAPRSGDVVVLDEGAVVYGSLCVLNATNVTITGRGIFDGSKLERADESLKAFHREHNLPEIDTESACFAYSVYGSENVTISGVTFRDPPFWTLVIRNQCRHTLIDNIHIVGNWRYNSDGVDVCASADTVIRNSFFRTFDDGVIARGPYMAGEYAPVSGMVVSNCSFYIDWGVVFKAQVQDFHGSTIEDVKMADCRVLSMQDTGIFIAVRYGCDLDVIRRMTFEDLEFDFGPQMAAMIQNADGEKFSSHRLTGNNLATAHSYTLGKNLGDQRNGKMEDPSYYRFLFEDFAFRRFRVYGERRDFSVRLKSLVPNHEIRRVVIEDLPPHQLIKEGNVSMAETIERDVIVYGSSPAAITAAIEAQKLGKSVVIVSPEKRIGGLTTGGLGMTDVGSRSACGGLALKFYRDIRSYYRNPKHWKWQQPQDFATTHHICFNDMEDAMWVFAPSAALAVLENWESSYGLDIRRDEWLDRSSGGVRTEGQPARIASFSTLSGNVYRGKMFIDATYDGDLMAAAGVSYFVGREDNSVYGETLSGFQPHPKHGGHRLKPGIDPYRVKGDPKSGLLPGVLPYSAVKDRKVGSGDKNVQAYNYRMCLTDCEANRIPFKKPIGYDEGLYELLFRNYEAGQRELPRNQKAMPDLKTDTNNHSGFSSDFIGQNWNWPEASYAEREQMAREHLIYHQGLMWTLANHPRIPEEVRREFSRWGTCKDEFLDGPGDGWQYQLYVREARRMIGEYVVTEHDCRRRRITARPIAMASYGMDSHNTMRYVGEDGFVHNEGDIQDWQASGVAYGIDYGALTPKRAECANLLVPVCLSASHMAFGSIRMEPVFFELGQSAGAAAALAIVDGVAVQDVDYAKLRDRLLLDGQYLEDKRASLSPMTSVIIERPDLSSIQNAASRAEFVSRVKQFANETHPQLMLFGEGSLTMSVSSAESVRETMRTLGRELRAAVREVSPETRLGSNFEMDFGSEINALVAFARELAVPGRPLVRDGAFNEKLPEDFEIFTDATSEGTIFARIASGANDLVYCAAPDADASRKPRYLEVWGRCGKKLNALKAALVGKHRRGVQIVSGVVSGAAALSRFGIPFTTREMSVKLLAGTEANSLSDADIQRLLEKGGVLIDSEAADILRERGFGERINCQGARIAITADRFKAFGSSPAFADRDFYRDTFIRLANNSFNIYASVVDAQDVYLFVSTNNSETEMILTAVNMRPNTLSKLDLVLSDWWREAAIEEVDASGKWHPGSFAGPINPGQARVFRLRKTL